MFCGTSDIPQGTLNKTKSLKSAIPRSDSYVFFCRVVLQDVDVMAKLIGGAPAMTDAYAFLMQGMSLNFNAKGSHGQTLLQLFFLERNLQVVNFLCEYAGVDLDRAGAQRFESWQMLNEHYRNHVVMWAIFAVFKDVASDFKD